MSPPTYYEILSLSPTLFTSPSFSHPTSPNQTPTQLIKRAYRRALLSHHPDKSNQAPPNTTPSTRPSYSIDQISLAYATLSNPLSRAAYDKQLLTTPSSTSSSIQGEEPFQTGIETIDLDDLSYSPDGSQGGEWFRSCRCGNERGFRLGEDDLEAAAANVDGLPTTTGELMVGCVDCSLWLRVQFAVVAGEEGDEGAEG